MGIMEKKMETIYIGVTLGLYGDNGKKMEARGCVRYKIWGRMDLGFTGRVGRGCIWGHNGEFVWRFAGRVFGV